MERKQLDERVDCRSFKDRGIDEQPTIHEGVTARIIEKCGGVSDHCDINRQICRDNALLRDLKSLVNNLSEIVENTAAKIAEKLESFRNNMITLKYKFIFHKKQIKQVEAEKQITPNLIKQFRELSAEIEQKAVEYKKIKSDKATCSPLNILRQNQLSKQLESLSKEIKVLKSDKEFALFELGCKTEKDVNIVEQNYKYNLDVAKKIKARNTDLQTKYKSEKSNYVEIKNNIPSENIPAVQTERTEIQVDGIYKTRRELESVYKNKFDSDIFVQAQKSVNDDLSEKPLKKPLMEQLHRKHTQQKFIYNKLKNNEIER